MTASAPARLPRISGLDVARAIALLGMFAAHVGDLGTSTGAGWPWLISTHGRASALFTVLAGVSISLMLSRSSAADPVRHTRIRVAVRGGLLLVLGWVLSALETPVDIILDNMGVMFFMALIAMRWRARTLIAVGVGIMIIGRAVLTPAVEHMPVWLYDVPVVHELWGFHYPALLWIGYLLVGMGLGRVAPWRGRRLGWLAASGIALAVVAYGTGTWLMNALGSGWQGNRNGPPEPEWYTTEAHSYTAFEMLGNVGVSLAVIALCCALAGALPRLTWPLAATGSMTLTLYSAHIVLIAIVGREIVYEPTNVAWVALCLGCIAFASLWKWTVGQGPLENGFTAASTAVADLDARARVRGRA